MNAISEHRATFPKRAEAPKYVEVTVEQLVVYRYHVPADEADPEGVAMARFLAGEDPDAGPSGGEQHDLTTYFVGEVELT
jgi:hypothetical protein